MGAPTPGQTMLAVHELVAGRHEIRVAGEWLRVTSIEKVATGIHVSCGDRHFIAHPLMVRLVREVA